MLTCLHGSPARAGVRGSGCRNARGWGWARSPSHDGRAPRAGVGGPVVADVHHRLSTPRALRLDAHLLSVLTEARDK